MVKVSIITVCLNSEKYIEQTIKSVLNQNYKNIEYIIVDGLSIDNTMKIIEGYKGKFNGRMRVISEKDTGLYNAMNKGIRIATGEVIGIINSDDWYERDTVDSVMEVYNKNKNSVIYGAMLRKYKNESFSILSINNHKDLYDSMIAHPTVFIPKKIYIENGSFDETYKLAADYELMLRLYSNKIKFIFIPKILANFRCGGLSEKMKADSISEVRKIKKIYCKKSKYDEEEAFVKSNLIYFWDNLIKKINFTNKNKIFIYGIGTHTKKLLEYIKTKINKKILGLIGRDDEITTEELYGYKLFDLNHAINSAEIIIISSYLYELDIYYRLKNVKEKIDIWTLYSVCSVKDGNKLLKLL